MEPEISDYLTAIGTLIVIATYDLPGLISLECDERRMPNIDTFRENANTVAVPILNKNEVEILVTEILVTDGTITACAKVILR